MLEQADAEGLGSNGRPLCLLPGAVWAQAQAPSDAERYYGWGPHMMGWGGGWYAMIFGPFFMILFLAVLVALAVILVRWPGGPWRGTYPPHQLPPAAKSGQKTPDGYYNVERMLKGVLAGKGQVLLCGTCMDARGLADAEMLGGVRRSTMAELATVTVSADKVLVF
jgi:DsrE/DsrF-like family